MANDVGDLPDPQGETDEFLRKLIEKIDTSQLAQNIARVTEALTTPTNAPARSDLPYTDTDPATVPLGSSESTFTPSDLFAGLDVLLNKYLGVKPAPSESGGGALLPPTVTLPPIPTPIPSESEAPGSAPVSGDAPKRESAAPWRGGWPLPPRDNKVESPSLLPPIPLPPQGPAQKEPYRPIPLSPIPTPASSPSPEASPKPSGSPGPTPTNPAKRDWTLAELLQGLDALFRKYATPKTGPAAPIPGGPGGPVPAGGTGPSTPDMGALFKKYFGKGGPYPKTGTVDRTPPIRHGLGGFAKGKAKFAWRAGKVRRWRGAGRQIGAGVGRSLGLEAAGVARLAALGAAAGAATAGVSIAIAAVAAVVVGFIKARDAVDKWTDQALATARRLSEWSGSMTVVMAERDIMQMMRDVKRGEATAGSARGLVHAEAGRKEEENRIATVIDNATNQILTVLNDVIGGILRPVADTLELVDEAVRKWLGKPREVGAGGLAATLDDVAAAARRGDAAARDLMAIAREAAIAAGGPGVAAPDGAAPRGRLP